MPDTDALSLLTFNINNPSPERAERRLACLADRGLSGHRQVADAHLVALCLANDGRLVTFDPVINQLAPPKAAVVPSFRPYEGRACAAPSPRVVGQAGFRQVRHRASPHGAC